MSRKNILGEVRRSQVLGYGPGAIIDFRAGKDGGGPVSVVAPGLEFWDEYAQPPYPRNTQVIHEPRLQKKLGVTGFRLPPVTLDRHSKTEEDPRLVLPGFRFPQWLQCPSCQHMKYASKWGKDPGDASRWCLECSTNDRKVHVVPTRFVVACKKGHLDEFPWLLWLKRDAEKRKKCKGDRFCKPKMENRGGTGLSSLQLRCGECGISESMGDIFREGALGGIRCRGNTPWLKKDNENCGEELRVLQRGASNLYFPVEVSALSIPPWSDAFQEALGTQWEQFSEAEDTELPILVKSLTKDIRDKYNITVEELCEEIKTRKKYLENPERDDLRRDEFYSFTGEIIFKSPFKNPDFKVTRLEVPEILQPLISRSIRADRLREVRALKGFTRIHQSATEYEEGKAEFGKISSEKLSWLPAIDVRGEGLFFSLDDREIENWTKQDEIFERAQIIDKAVEEDWHEAVGDVPRPFKITAKFLLLHTFSHLVMRHISLESGYDTASIRERVYCDVGEKSNNGILLYTASSDAEGTLGGLSRMAEEDKLVPLIIGAVRSASWCSSDPLCIKDVVSESEAYNLAACHNCSLVPETSCEFFNRYLDRAFIVGSPDYKFKGFFEPFLRD